MADETTMETNGAQAQSSFASPTELHHPLSEARKSSIQAGLAAFHETQQECEELRRQTAELRMLLSESQARVQQLEAAVNEAESRAAAARAERDHEVAERAVVEGLFSLIRRTLETADLPEPVLKRRLKQAGVAPAPPPAAGGGA